MCYRHLQWVVIWKIWSTKKIFVLIEKFTEKCNFSKEDLSGYGRSMKTCANCIFQSSALAGEE